MNTMIYILSGSSFDSVVFVRDILRLRFVHILFDTPLHNIFTIYELYAFFSFLFHENKLWSRHRSLEVLERKTSAHHITLSCSAHRLEHR
jgi:hypothetical protein